MQASASIAAARSGSISRMRCASSTSSRYAMSSSPWSTRIRPRTSWISARWTGPGEPASASSSRRIAPAGRPAMWASRAASVSRRTRRLARPGQASGALERRGGRGGRAAPPRRQPDALQRRGDRLVLAHRRVREVPRPRLAARDPGERRVRRPSRGTGGAVVDRRAQQRMAELEPLAHDREHAGPLGRLERASTRARARRARRPPAAPAPRRSRRPPAAPWRSAAGRPESR